MFEFSKETKRQIQLYKARKLKRIIHNCGFKNKRDMIGRNTWEVVDKARKYGYITSNYDPYGETYIGMSWGLLDTFILHTTSLHKNATITNITNR